MSEQTTSIGQEPTADNAQAKPPINNSPIGNTASGLNMEPNIEAAFSYIPLVNIAVLMMEKENKAVRFHAMQSILFWGVVIFAYSIANFLKLILIGTVLEPLIGMGSLVVWLYLTWRAYNNEQFELPYLGKIARDLINK